MTSSNYSHFEIRIDAQFTCFSANQSASFLIMDSRVRIDRDAGERKRVLDCHGYIFEIIYLRVMSEQYPHSAQFAFQQELLLPILFRLGQIASATL